MARGDQVACVAHLQHSSAHGRDAVVAARVARVRIHKQRLVEQRRHGRRLRIAVQRSARVIGIHGPIGKARNGRVGELLHGFGGHAHDEAAPSTNNAQ